MKKILLVCSAGMSTSMLVKKMQDTANKEGKEYEVEALALSEAETKVDEVDVILLGPQVRFQKAQVEKVANGKVPVDVIDMQQYGMMDGEGVLKHAESLMK
ncbi:MULTISPECIES: PTS sugar transporter subunit IIB [Mammaliicoccus]|uniref:PTS sugar transporter subunit IIB n=1 Tax=Mammaliicoccus sciuri TaxID=1296 RepID=A0A8E2VEI5_MAMSC|nr:MULTISPECIES: PTS sugar transporter subunit IIB [Mammaliicoccus]MBF9298933.1 PTS sugar transporter subunit IIB [Staphylococcus schleiferi]MBN4908991.1 PTS sugar transporter subunit IIB [Staphylococcus sp. EG-SA-13]ARB40045.1 PTS sugar transporter subunit IIB [Mammaliicoccus sciuri]MCD8799372.1 PTS sugar transporter subunit IIB [Mammaliicoccus sciuri]MCD8809528.1 PTS sugar transporter subunit IIB [Mammaliicoccus sciuri]